MRIEQEIKLDYKDVLIRPKRSTLKSRKDVSLKRTYTFRNSQQTWAGIPIMAANMDGVGTFKMHNELSKYNLFTCTVKHYDDKDWETAQINHNYIALSIGTSIDMYNDHKYQ